MNNQAPSTTIVCVHRFNSLTRAQRARLINAVKECDARYAYHSAQGKGWFAVPNLGSPFTQRFASEIRACATSMGVDL